MVFMPHYFAGNSFKFLSSSSRCPLRMYKFLSPW